MYTLLLVILILMLVGSLPPFGLHQYGYGPAGLLGTVLIVILVLFLLGRL